MSIWIIILLLFQLFHIFKNFHKIQLVEVLKRSLRLIERSIWRTNNMKISSLLRLYFQCHPKENIISTILELDIMVLGVSWRNKYVWTAREFLKMKNSKWRPLWAIKPLYKSKLLKNSIMHGKIVNLKKQNRGFRNWPKYT